MSYTPSNILRVILEEVIKYYDGALNEETRLTDIILSDDLSAICLALEREFGVKPDRNLYKNIFTVKDLHDLFNEELKLQ